MTYQGNSDQTDSRDGISAGGGAGPYAQAAWLYRQAGWMGVIPLPPGRKSPPPSGYTGWAGADPSGADLQAWVDGPEGAGNVALHLGDGVIGIDVDAYGDKGGATALEKLTESAGCPLPPTWVSTARDDGVSGIRFYRAVLPPGRVWIDQPGGTGAGIEAVHRGHRYAVVWPSTNPDAAGAQYRWYPGWEGGPRAVAPEVASLPELPAAWVEVLSRPGEVAQGSAAGHVETLAAVDGWRTGQACGVVWTAAQGALARLAPGTVRSEALHPTANGDIWELVRLGHEGHVGAREALARHYSAFLVARGDVRGEGREKAEAEWWRMVRGAVGKLPARVRAGGLPPDPCAGALFDPGMPPGSMVMSDPFPGAGTGGPAEQATERSPGTDAESAPGPPALRDRFLDLAGLRKVRPPRALIKDVLHLNTESWLIGPPGGFKSFVALDWACTVATGRPWRGKRVVGGPVWYVAAEGAPAFGKRVEAWVADRGVEPAGLSVLPVAVQANGGAVGGMPMLNPQWRELCGLAAERAPVLIVLDTQARMTVGLEENSNTAMGLWIAAVGMLREACGACVLVVHHTGRDGKDARGASALDGAQDMEWKVARIGATGKELKAKLSCDKSKDGRDDLSFAFEMRVVDLGLDEDGDAVTSLVLGADVTGDESSGIGAIEAIEKEAAWLSIEQWVKRTLEVMDADGSGMPAATLLRVINDMRARGGVEPIKESVLTATVSKAVTAGRLVRPVRGRVALAPPGGGDMLTTVLGAMS